MQAARSAPRHHGITDVGLRRSNNEDALISDPEAGLYVVSDGMGGRNAGEVAARAVVEELPRLLRARLGVPGGVADADLPRVLHDSVHEVSQQIFKMADGKSNLAGLGATLVMALLRESTAWIVNMGDSVAYLYRTGELYRLTDEHNVAALLLARGDISHDEYSQHPARGVLSRHMGMKQVVYPDVRSLDLEAGDRLLLCSDGLTSMVPDAGIQKILQQDAGCEAAAAELIDAAKAGGGRDNVTVLLIDPLPGI
jgi:protein phosphatase